MIGLLKNAFCYSKNVFLLSFNPQDVREIAKSFVLQTNIIRSFRDSLARKWSMIVGTSLFLNEVINA